MTPERMTQLAYATASRLALPADPSFDREDVIGAALLGILRAEQTFDPGKGVSRDTWAISRDRFAIKDLLRDMDHLSRSERKEATLDPEDVRWWAPFSLSEIEEDDHSCVLSDGTYVPGSDEHLEALEPRESPAARNVPALLEAIGRLPDHERQILVLRYQEGLSLGEIDQQCGFNHKSAQKRHQRILERLRRLINEEGER